MTGLYLITDHLDGQGWVRGGHRGVSVSILPLQVKPGMLAFGPVMRTNEGPSLALGGGPYPCRHAACFLRMHHTHP